MIMEIEEILSRLKREVEGYQVPLVDLIAVQSRDPFKILVATILSARTKDEVTAAAAQRLFSRAETAAALARLSRSELEQLIYPVGFYRNKAGYLYKLPAVLAEEFAGLIPETMEGLLRLPGVGRKTANLVLALAFHQPAICVDTHVHRIMNIWGYVRTATPLQTEMALREKLPPHLWIEVNSILVAFGQGTCRPQAPHCDRCVIAADCPQLGVSPRSSGPAPRQAAGGQTFVSWNVNGLRAVLKKDFLSIFHTLAADIFALQEIKALPEQLPPEVLDIPGYHSYWHPAEKKGYAGTAVFTRIEPLRVLYGLGEEEIDREGRVLTLEYEDFFLVNTYFPNAQPELRRLPFKERFNRALLTFIQGLAADKSVVLCGDLNVAHRPIDLARPQANEENPGYSRAERSWMDQLIGAGYVDTFREFDRQPGRYSWWSYRSRAREKNIGWRIDYFLVDARSRGRLLHAAIHEDIYGSDHCPVSINYR